MQVRCWGTRGSIATPGHGTVRYGGNTSCVELRGPGGELVVLDCGTGARPLGLALMEESRDSGRPLAGSILIGHTHWDHIQGLPFFAPLFDPAARWDVYGPRGLRTSLGQTLSGQMQYQYFPVSLDQVQGAVEYHDLVEGTFTVGGLTIHAQYLNHPALTLGYRIEAGGVTACYVADHEPFDPLLGAGGDVLGNPLDRHHVELLSGADLVLHDAQYDAAEYADRIGWGHSPMEYVVDVACAAGVGRLVLTHHDPSHDDAAIDALVERARARADGRVEVEAAVEGRWLHVERTHRSVATAPLRPSAMGRPALDERSAGIALAVPDEAIRTAVAEAAAGEHLVVIEVDAGGVPDGAGWGVVAVDADDDDSLAAMEELRDALDEIEWARRGILAFTRSMSVPSTGPLSAANWLVWPASEAHVRTKLRATLLRTACRWVAAPLPPDEDRRLAALNGLRVLDTPPEQRFDRLTEEACERFGVPIALITLVDRDRQWFKSRQGLPVSETPRDQSICAHAILGPEVLQIPDLFLDARFADNPVVAGVARARFYAGAPLTLADGSRVGTLCLADHRPRLLDDDDLVELRRLASEVVRELQRRGTEHP